MLLLRTEISCSTEQEVWKSAKSIHLVAATAAVAQLGQMAKKPARNKIREIDYPTYACNILTNFVRLSAMNHLKRKCFMFAEICLK